jgi:hypothetical protein
MPQTSYRWKDRKEEETKERATHHGCGEEEKKAPPALYGKDITEIAEQTF